METVRRALASDEHATLRMLGGVLFGIGALVLLYRRTYFADPWGDGAIFLTLAIPAVVLYGGGFIGARAAGRTSAWQSTFAVFGALLIPAALFAFLQWVGGDTNSSLNQAWILALGAIAGFAAGLAARVRYCCLIGAVLLALAWLTLWDEILSDGLQAHIGTLRWLLVAIGLILLLVASAVAMRGSDEGGSSDVVTAATLALVAAGAVTGFAGLSGGILITATDLRSSVFWDLELLVAGLGALTYGTASGVRGPAYVGALGLGVLVVQLGLDLDDRSPSGAVVGWPLLLLIAGAAALAISLAPGLRNRR